MEKTMFELDDKVQVNVELPFFGGIIIPAGAIGSVIIINPHDDSSATFEFGAYGIVSMSRNFGTYISLIETAIEPASEPTPAHRFPVGAVVVLHSSDPEYTERTVTVQGHHISRYGGVQYVVSGQRFMVYEEQLSAL